MKLYVIKINEQGSLLCTTEEPRISKLGFKRYGGQRYQVPSIMRFAKEEKDPVLIEATSRYMDALTKHFIQNKGAVIEWAITTDNIRYYRLPDGTEVATRQKWGDWDLDMLDATLAHYVQPLNNMGGQQNSTNQQMTGGQPFQQIPPMAGGQQFPPQGFQGNPQFQQPPVQLGA